MFTTTGHNKSISIFARTLQNKSYNKFIMGRQCLRIRLPACLIFETSEWISIKFGTGRLHYNLFGEFNFGQNRSSII
jgi:hypothetical protein